MIQNKLIYFNYYNNFRNALNSGLIADSSIVFVGDRHSIFTRGVEFGATDTDGIQQLVNSAVINYLQNFYSRSQIDLLLQQYIKKNEIKTINGQSILGGGDITITSGSEYIAGAGINIENDTVSLKSASNNEIGGVKLGYVATGKTYPVQVDGGNRAFVSVPWEEAQGGGEQGPAGGYYQIIFKAVPKGTVPTLPMDYDNNPEGWGPSALNVYNSNNAVWMATRFVDGDGDANAWQGPWCITGNEGDAGADGDSMEFIYARTTVEDSSILSNPNSGIKSAELKLNGDPVSEGNTPSANDFVPAGWYDNPAGIDATNKYEWMCVRHKTNGTWGQFIGPVLWSAYGRTGTDGDGVEYIYFAHLVSTPAHDPHEEHWENDSDFQTREYIRTGTGWVDDPIDLTTIGKGAKQWVSVRKKYADVVGGSPYWHAYSSPKLWSYYAKDGDAGIGLTADFDNDMMAVSMKPNGYNYAFQQEATLTLFNGTNELVLTSDPTIVSVTDAAGNTLSSSYFTIATGTSTVTVNIPADTFNFETVGTIFVTVRAASSVNDAPVSRDAVLQIIGFKFGSDGDNGASYRLNVSTPVIKQYRNSTKAPANITCSCIRTEGTNNITTWASNELVTASGTHFGDGSYFEIKYYIDDGVAQSLSSASLSTATISDQVRFVLLYYKNSNTYIVDQETVFVVQDGQNAAPAISYNIQVAKSTLKKTYASDSNSVDKFGGAVYFKIQKVNGSERTFVGEGDSNNITTKIYIGGSSSNQVTPICGTGNQYYWNQSQTNWNESLHTFIEIIAFDINNIPVTSAIVPTIIPGKDGQSAQIQSLDMAVMRIRNYTSNPSPVWNDGTPGHAENGIKYTDIVLYGNDYYRCISAQSALYNEPSYEGNSAWELFSFQSTAAFDMMLANSAYIKMLSASNIIMMKDNGGSQTPVAGMLTGSYIPQELGGNAQGTTSNSNGIRIFAGTVQNGNFAQTAFTVDEEGTVRAGKGKILLNQDGSGRLADGNITWDTNGNITANQIDIKVGGLSVSGLNTEATMKNAVIFCNLQTVYTSSFGYGNYLTADAMIYREGLIVSRSLVSVDLDDLEAYHDNYADHHPNLTITDINPGLASILIAYLKENNVSFRNGFGCGQYDSNDVIASQIVGGVDVRSSDPSHDELISIRKYWQLIKNQYGFNSFSDNVSIDYVRYGNIDKDFSSYPNPILII